MAVRLLLSYAEIIKTRTNMSQTRPPFSREETDNTDNTVDTNNTDDTDYTNNSDDTDDTDDIDDTDDTFWIFLGYFCDTFFVLLGRVRPIIWYSNIIQIVGPNSSICIWYSDFVNTKLCPVFGFFGTHNSIWTEYMSDEFHIFSEQNVLYWTNIFILIYFFPKCCILFGI